MGMPGRLAGILGVAALVLAASLGLRDEADGREYATPEEVLDLRIEVLEARYESPYDLATGSRLAADYATRFGATASLEDLARAEEITTELLATWPDKSGLRNRLAALYITQHRFGDAFDLAAANVAADSADVGALGVLFDAAMATGRYDVAAHALGALDPDQFGRRIREARWLAAHGEETEAIRVQTAACEEVASSSGNHLVEAWCFRRLADLESGAAADAALERSEGAWPGYRGVREARADEAYAEGRWQDAGEGFLTLRSDAHPDIYLRLAEVADALHRPDEAARWRSDFMRVAGDPDVEALYAHSLAEHLASQPGRRAEALAIMRRDVIRRPSVETYSMLAWVLLQNDRPGEALEAVQAARSFGRPDGATTYLLARALEGLGRHAAARDHRAAAEADPGSLPHMLQREIRAGR